MTSVGGLRQPMPARMSEEEICAHLLDLRALDIRDVDGGEAPFHYSSGNFGPGYVDIKGTVGAQHVFKSLVEQVAVRLIDDNVEFDNIAGNATGGIVPAYECREAYQQLTDRVDIGYVYVRGSRKQGGKGELVTGLQHIPPNREDGSPAQFLVMEELVNFAETTTNSLLHLRELGFIANQGATILHYDHIEANAKLAENGITLTALTTLPFLLEAAIELGRFPRELVDSYKAFQANPTKWRADRGWDIAAGHAIPIGAGGTVAMPNGDP
jgi:orotate phosphoribosyltransferase